MKPLFSKLSAWKKIDEDEGFVEKAIDSLYKKLKTKQGAIEELQYILENPSSSSNCITIPRSLDGRLQVSHRKGLPHVIYCRIFRWPDLLSHHELKPSCYCKYSFSSMKNEVCINPFHYDRIDIPILPPVLVPKLVEFSPGHSLTFNQTHEMRNNQNSMNLMNPTIPVNNYMPLSSNNFKPNNFNQHYYDQNSVNTNLNSSSSFNSVGSPQDPLEECNDCLSNISYGSSSKKSDLFDQNAYLNWCSIVYYELNTRVGEIFQSSSHDIFVDGFTNPSSNLGRRFCLGLFSNINRTQNIENTRKHIGKGIHIYYDNSDVYIECLSDSPIFIQSRNCNFDRGFHPNTVCKLLSGYSLRIFQTKIFAEHLRESINHGYDTVYELSNMCVIKISFVKGWGADYYRQDVSSCPCWIELRLNEPFQWLDKVLKEMGKSMNPVTSVS